MSNFIYKVKNEKGETFSGILEAVDKKSARRKLIESGYYVTVISPIKQKRKFDFGIKRVNLDTLILFTHLLSSMLEAGLPILTCLDTLWKQIDNIEMQLVISRLKDKLNSGQTLSEAMNEFPDVFSVLYRNVLSVGETGAGIVPVLKKLLEYLNIQRAFISRIKKAITYPSIVVVLSILVIIGMFVGVIPVFQKVLYRIKVDLPFLTLLVLNFSKIMRTPYFWIITMGVLIILYFLYKTLKNTSRGCLLIDKVKLRIPIMGKIFYIDSIGRFTFSLGLLLKAGINITKSIEIAAETISNKYIRDSLEWVKKRLTEGNSLSDSLEEIKIFPPLLIVMTAIGEKSGSLVEMLERVAVYFEEELDYRLNKFLTFLEPLLIIFIGGIVLFILLSIYLPIFTLWKALG